MIRRAGLRYLAAAVLALGAACGWNSSGRASAAPPVRSSGRDVVHVLARLTFGVRVADIERVRRTGILPYIDEQLHPDHIDDQTVEAMLTRLPTLAMTTGAIAREYYLPAIRARRERKREEVRAVESAGRETTEQMNTAAGRRPVPRSEEMRKQREVIAALIEQKMLRAVYSERQLQEVLVDFWFNHFNVFAGKGLDRVLLTEYERDAIRPHVLGRFRDLLGATAESPAMLYYLDNWMSADPGGPHDRPALDAQPGIRRPFGRRARSVPGTGPGSAARAVDNGSGRMGMAREAPLKKNRKNGLNENYARELMELHTLGVDGGYTQQDVVEVARAFTGWTIGRLDDPRLFRFDPAIHDAGEKHVLGHTIEPGGGQSDGRQVLDILARHPSTARFIATKLARRFVADEPPPALVDRAAAKFRDTDGDLREVVRTIVTSSEFFAATAYRAKVKTPLELVASALRVTGARIESGNGAARALEQLGMPPYSCQPPTGYPDSAEAWVNGGALINRMNFAVALAGNQVPGIHVDPLAFETRAGDNDIDGMRREVVRGILQDDVSETTLAILEKATDRARLLALAIGAPEFQRR